MTILDPVQRRQLGTLVARFCPLGWNHASVVLGFARGAGLSVHDAIVLAARVEGLPPDGRRSPVGVSSEAWRGIYLAHRRRCAFCNRALGITRLAMTPVVPYERGGLDDAHNKVPICADCALGPDRLGVKGRPKLHPEHAAIFAARQEANRINDRGRRGRPSAPMTTSSKRSKKKKPKLVTGPSCGAKVSRSKLGVETGAGHINALIEAEIKRPHAVSASMRAAVEKIGEDFARRMSPEDNAEIRREATAAARSLVASLRGGRTRGKGGGR